MKGFGSDNYSGVHPEVMEALRKANAAHEVSYGNDGYTPRAAEKFKQLFGEEAEVFFVYNGTGANVLGLGTLVKSYQSVLCSAGAHIQVDESTAPERFLGCRIVPVPSPDGKIYPDEIRKRIQRLGDQHHPQAKVISISQASEYGTVYTPGEVMAISQIARQHGLYLHMDGSRISNAAAFLDVPFAAFTRDAGVDVLSFGGTKNGLMFGEAIVFFRPGLARDFLYQRKQGMQLHSKMRFISAQFEALLTEDLWLRNALRTNGLAQLLEKELREIKGIRVTQKVEANAVFVSLPRRIIAPLQEIFSFYVWNEEIDEVRLMCSWDTTEKEVGLFIQKVKDLL